MPEGADRVTVSTYVPAAQQEFWQEDAEALGMSQSEFVRSMVQAGRRSFSLDGRSANPEEPPVAGANPRGNDARMTILEVLRSEGPLEWADLVDALTADVETDLENALDELQSENRVQHSGRRGGYVVVEAPDGE